MPGGSMMKDGGISTIVGGFGGRTSGVEIGGGEIGGSTAIGGISPVVDVVGDSIKYAESCASLLHGVWTS